MKNSRRDFVRKSFLAGAAVALGKTRLCRAAAITNPAKSATRSRLAAVSGKDAGRMFARAVEMLGGSEKFVSPGDRVVIKPNASFANPANWGNNTSPEVLAAACEFFIKAGARKVVVIDYPLMGGAKAPEANGLADVCRSVSGVELSVLSARYQFRKLSVPGGATLKTVEVSREVLDADLLVNLPVAKAHDAVAASIGLKNLMGIIWDRAAFHTMLEINRAIAELSLAVRPQLTVVDMTRVMVSNGPKGPGEVATPNLLVASVDPVAADAYSLTKARFNGRRFKPKQIRYLRHAHQAGLGEIDLSAVDIREDRV